MENQENCTNLRENERKTKQKKNLNGWSLTSINMDLYAINQDVHLPIFNGNANIGGKLLQETQ